MVMTGTPGAAGATALGLQAGAMGDLRTAAAQLLVELRMLEQRQQSERDRWLDSWFDRQEQAWSVVPPPEHPSLLPDPSLLPVYDTSSTALAVERLQPEPVQQVQEVASSMPLKLNGVASDPMAVVPCMPTKGPSEGRLSLASGQTPRNPSKTHSDSNTSLTKKHEKQPSKKHRKKINTFRLMEANVKVDETKLKKFTKSRYYEMISGGLIVVNALIIGYETQFTANVMREYRAGLRQGPNTGPFFVVLQVLFCIAFTVELALRWAADGLIDFFRSGERGWNIFDTLVVVVSIIDICVLSFLNSDSENGELLGNISLLRVLRVVRIVRVARVIRVMRFFRELRMMVFSILGSLKSLLWSFMVLGLCFFVFGISLTSGSTEYMESTRTRDWAEMQNEPVLLYFGTLDNSVLHLYMSITGGNDWGMYYEALEALPFQYRFFFMVFMFFSIIAVLNIVTGVFVESAMLSGTTDREILVHEEMESKRAYQRSMREFFEEADEDGTGSMSYDEFTKKLDDERVIAYFNAFKLDVSDASLLFTLLDYDQSGEIQIDEFLDGCYKLQGESRALDMKVMQLEVKWLKETFQKYVEGSHADAKG